MIKIEGTYNTAIVYADTIEAGAEGQIQKLVSQEFTKGSRIRIMPDVHAGKGCTIGTTMTIMDKIVPNLVGVDIGCGMETVELKAKRINLPELDSFIHKNIPCGFEIRSDAHKYIANTRLEELYCKEAVSMPRAECSLGTLGGGNHFIEVDKAEDGTLYLVVHSGSRNAGLQVAKYYQDKAYALLKEGGEIPYELAYCEGELLEQYLHDMQIMQEFADWNRRAITDTILKGCKLKEQGRFTTIHNYIDIENRILRKGGGFCTGRGVAADSDQYAGRFADLQRKRQCRVELFCSSRSRQTDEPERCQEFFYRACLSEGNGGHLFLDCQCRNAGRMPYGIQEQGSHSGTNHADRRSGAGNPAGL